MFELPLFLLFALDLVYLIFSLPPSLRVNPCDQIFPQQHQAIWARDIPSKNGRVSVARVDHEQNPTPSKKLPRIRVKVTGRKGL